MKEISGKVFVVSKELINKKKEYEYINTKSNYDKPNEYTSTIELVGNGIIENIGKGDLLTYSSRNLTETIIDGVSYYVVHYNDMICYSIV